MAERLRAMVGSHTQVRVVDFDRRGAWVAREGQAAA
jgi:hypothetical protein